jgi:hypothetical protein
VRKYKPKDTTGEQVDKPQGTSSDHYKWILNNFLKLPSSE